MSIRRAQLGRVVRWEFRTTVTRWGYILSTLALPLMPLFAIFLDTLIDPEKMIAGNEPAQVGIVDQSGFLNLEFTPGDPGRGPLLPPGVNLSPEARRALERLRPESDRPPDVYHRYPNAKDARADLLAGALTGYIVVTKEWIDTGTVDAYRVRRESQIGHPSPFGTRLGSVLRGALLVDRLEPKVLARVMGTAAARKEHVLNAAGDLMDEEVLGAEIRRFVVPVMAAAFLSVALFTGAGYLLLGLSEEKENRVLELLLAALTPDELLAGKLLGIGAAGLLQFAVWVSLVAVPLVLWLPALGLTFAQLFWATGFFLGGYALFGALMLGVGAIADTARHAQQLSGIFTLLAMVPFLFNFVIIQEPMGTFARVLTFVPLTSPITVMLRMSSASISGWELGAALFTLFASAWLALKGAARVFRVSLLLHGNRASVADVWRWLRSP